MAGNSGKDEALELFSRAETACRSALLVFKREQFERDWAMAQNNLGDALRGKAGCSQGVAAVGFLVEAVAAYHASLEVLTEDQFPTDYASVSRSLQAAETELRRLH